MSQHTRKVDFPLQNHLPSEVHSISTTLQRACSNNKRNMMFALILGPSTPLLRASLCPGWPIRIQRPIHIPNGTQTGPPWWTNKRLRTSIFSKTVTQTLPRSKRSQSTVHYLAHMPLRQASFPATRGNLHHAGFQCAARFLLRPPID